MNNSQIIQKTAVFIAREFATEASGHDWFHVDRVRRLAVKIGQMEGANAFVTEMAALLHDLDDWKIAGNESHFPFRAKQWLNEMEVDPLITSAILNAIEEVSYKGAAIATPVRSLEAAVVQDADRLDAMGAIGIARTFSYGGHKGRLIYDPDVAPEMHVDFESYKSSKAPTINHFYEKLLLLKDRMNTPTARKMAGHRHQVMENFLEAFFNEWKAEI